MCIVRRVLCYVYCLMHIVCFGVYGYVLRCALCVMSWVLYILLRVVRCVCYGCDIHCVLCVVSRLVYVMHWVSCVVCILFTLRAGLFGMYGELCVVSRVLCVVCYMLCVMCYALCVVCCGLYGALPITCHVCCWL